MMRRERAPGENPFVMATNGQTKATKDKKRLESIAFVTSLPSFTRRRARSEDAPQRGQRMIARLVRAHASPRERGIDLVALLLVGEDGGSERDVERRFPEHARVGRRG